MSDDSDQTPDPAQAREHSAALIRDHGPQLAQQAVQLRGMDPEARPVGLILTAGTREAAQLREVLGGVLGSRADAGTGLATLVPRHVALTILRQAAPAALDWLADDEEDGKQTLPLLVATPEGFRLGKVAYP